MADGESTRSRQLKRPVGSWPCLLAIAIGVFAAFISFGIAAAATEQRPSSTAPIAFVFVPFWGGVLAAIAVVAATALDLIGRRVGFSIRVGLAPLCLVLAAAIPAAWFLGATLARSHDASLAPRIIVSSHQVIRRQLSAAGKLEALQPNLLLSGMQGHLPSTITGTSMTMSLVSDGKIRIESQVHGTSCTLSFPEYITSVQACPIRGAGGEIALVAVVNLRAASRVSEIVVLSDRADILHREVIERQPQHGEVDLAGIDVRDRVARVVTIDGAVAIELSPPRGGPRDRVD